MENRSRGSYQRNSPAPSEKHGAENQNGGQKPKNYKDYRIWQLGIEIVDAIYSVTQDFPKEETNGLAAQMRSAAVAIPSEVAEGFVRRKEYVEYLYGALGFCARLDTQLFITGKRKYLNGQKIAALSDMIQEECRMLGGLIKAIHRNQNAGNFRPRQQDHQQEATTF